MGPKNDDRNGGSHLDGLVDFPAQEQVDETLMQKKPFTNASPKRENLVYKHEKYATRAEHSKEVSKNHRNIKADHIIGCFCLELFFLGPKEFENSCQNRS